MLLNWIKSNRGFIVLLLCFGIFRTAVADWNPIPSGSMRPTLLEGDVVFVNRLAYDLKLPLTDVVLARLGEPERARQAAERLAGVGPQLVDQSEVSGIHRF